MATDPRNIQQYLHLRWKIGLGQGKAAKEAGIGEWKARELDKGYANGQEARALREDADVPGPVAREDLCPEALRALDDFEFFRLRYFGHVSMPWHVEAAERMVALLGSDDDELIVVNCPPGSGKTTLFAHDIPAWLTVRDREVRGIIGSRTARQAETYTARLRKTFERRLPVQAKEREKNLGLAVDAVATLVDDFGRFKPDRSELWTREAFFVAQVGEKVVSEKEPTWTAFGMDSGSLGWRVDYFVWDDLVDKSTRSSEAEELQQVWWDDEAESRLEAGGCGVLQGQRLRSTDLYRYNLNKRILDEEGDETERPVYGHIVYKAHYDELCTGDHGRDAKPYPDGCLLDPKRLGWRKLQQKKANGKFETVYQQEDVDSSDVLVQKVWIDGGRGVDGVDHPGCWDKTRGLCELPVGLTTPVLSVATADPSPTKFWSLQWWVYHPETEQRFLMDLVRQAMDAPDFIDWDYGEGRFSGLMEEWQLRSIDHGLPITHWIVEANAAQRFMLQYDHVRRWKAVRSVEIIGHQTHRNKADEKRGVETIAPHYRFGRVRLPGRLMARTASLKLYDEVTKWGPDYRGTDDCVMAHWFLEYNLPRLAVVDLSKLPRAGRPSWMTSEHDRGTALTGAAAS